jgi:hypothetical protein
VFSTSWGVLIIAICMASFEGELMFLVEFDACFICLGFRESMIFAIEKAYMLVAALLNLEFGVCHPYGMV